MSRYINRYETDDEAYNAIKNGELSYPYVAYSEESKLYFNGEKPMEHYESQYFTIIAGDNGCHLTTENEVEYSTDNGVHWFTLDYQSSYTISDCGIILLRNNYFETGFVSRIQLDNDFTVEGNIMSLIYGDDFRGQYSLEGIDGGNYNGAFYGFFENSGILNAENLRLPATTLTEWCYAVMFSDCGSLSGKAPILPAPVLLEGSYYFMFDGSNVDEVVCLATDISAEQCVTNILEHSGENGTFYQAPGMTDWYPLRGYDIPRDWTITDYAG